MVEMVFRKNSTPKKSSGAVMKNGILHASDNFFWGRFFSEDHFDHFYGLHGHETIHHSEENLMNLYVVIFQFDSSNCSWEKWFTFFGPAWIYIHHSLRGKEIGLMDVVVFWQWCREMSWSYVSLSFCLVSVSSLLLVWLGNGSRTYRHDVLWNKNVWEKIYETNIAALRQGEKNELGLFKCVVSGRMTPPSKGLIKPGPELKGKT